MLRLSRKQIEAIGCSVWHDYRYSRNWPLCEPIDILEFSEKHLGLRHQYAKLSKSGELLGLTTYRDTEIELWHGDKPTTLLVPKNVMLLEEAMRKDKSPGRLCYTVAHECAHQILDRMDGDNAEDIFAKNRRAYSCRRLNSETDWQEWQANALAAVLLMPPELILWRFEMIYGIKRITQYGTRLNRLSVSFIEDCCKALSVSRKAFMIRLRELDLIERRKESEYTEDMEISFPWGGDVNAHGRRVANAIVTGNAG